ncbi:hypothetical protein PFISCL1PPCAC_6505, partial [Pristionchus fissidentatus]
DFRIMTTELEYNEESGVAHVEFDQIPLNKPKFGLTQDELDKMMKSSFWKPCRAFCVVLYWAILAALITGSVLIILFGEGVLA